MTIRLILLVFTALALAADTGLAGLMVHGIRAKMVDCYADGELEKPHGPVIEEKEWPPGPLPVERESEDGVFVRVKGRPCWFDRSQLKLDVPDSNECESDEQYGARGLGRNKKCQTRQQRK